MLARAELQRIPSGNLCSGKRKNGTGGAHGTTTAACIAIERAGESRRSSFATLRTRDRGGITHNIPSHFTYNHHIPTPHLHSLTALHSYWHTLTKPPVPSSRMGPPRHLCQLDLSRTSHSCRVVACRHRSHTAWAYYHSSPPQGYVATDMIENPGTEEEKQFCKEWNYRTPVGR